jgi:starch synthase
VRAVGGLKDTVVDLALPNATGITFHEYAPGALLEALERARALYKDPKALDEVRRRGMLQDHSWGRAAQQYEMLYERIASRAA